MKTFPLALLAFLSAASLSAQARINLPDRPISRVEVITAVKRQFAAMDVNRDGFVSPAEFERYRDRMQSAPSNDAFGHVGAHWFEHADANGDGRVSFAEAQARPMQLFDTADLNHDGVISVEERKIAMMLMGLHGM